MKTTIRLFGCVLVGLTALPAVAHQVDSAGPAQGETVEAAHDEPPAADAELPDVLSPREIAFEVSDEVLELKLFRADPELFKQQFVADVDFSSLSWQDYHESNNLIQSDKWLDLAWCEGSNLLVHGVGRQVDPESLHDFFEKMSRTLEKGPAKAPQGMEFFLSDATRDGRVTFSGSPDAQGQTGYYRFRILAPTAELARERAEALVQILDRSIRLPLLEKLKNQASASAEALAMFQEQLPAAVAKMKELDEEVFATKESYVDAEELKRLTTERRLLDVDLAGIRARIDAAEEIIARIGGEGGRGPEGGIRRRIEQLEDIKVTAEIDLAGLAARRKVLDEMIQAGKDREALVAKRNDSHKAVDMLDSNIDQLQSKLQNYRNTLTTYSKSLFALKDNKIVIHPIKWTGTE
jgi:hypothetical protein